MKSFVVLAVLVSSVLAQSAVYGQCGGMGWKGPTTCASGSVCTVSNPYYSQCLPGSSSGKSSATTTTSSAPTSTGSTSGGLPTSTSTVSSLNALAKQQGKLYFGTATDNQDWSTAAYTKILDSTMFGQVTPANAMKWGSVETANGTYNYAQGDALVSLAKTNGQVIRCHNLIWDNQMPSFVSNGNYNNATLLSLMNAHIVNEVTHYKGDCYAWDVVNEPFDDNGGMRSWLYQNTCGTAYIAEAFATARSTDPNAKLYLNDYNLETPGAKFNTALSTVKTLLAQGVPIDGIGFESHMIVGEVPTASALAAQMEEFTSLGLEVAITELDIRMTLPETSAQLLQQKADYESMVSACMMVEKCVGITLWDFGDSVSWVPGTFSGQGDACPWDSNWNRKPAYDGIVLGLGGTN